MTRQVSFQIKVYEQGNSSPAALSRNSFVNGLIGTLSTRNFLSFLFIAYLLYKPRLTSVHGFRLGVERGAPPHQTKVIASEKGQHLRVWYQPVAWVVNPESLDLASRFAEGGLRES